MHRFLWNKGLTEQHNYLLCEGHECFVAKALFWDTRRMSSDELDLVSSTTAWDSLSTLGEAQDDGSYTNSAPKTQTRAMCISVLSDNL